MECQHVKAVCAYQPQLQVSATVPPPPPPAQPRHSRPHPYPLQMLSGKRAWAGLTSIQILTARSSNKERLEVPAGCPRGLRVRDAPVRCSQSYRAGLGPACRLVFLTL